MKRRTLPLVTVAFAAFLAASFARGDRFWTLQLRGGAVVLSLDPPEERGPMLVFHRAPEGTFSSVRAESVERISIASGPARKARPSLEGQVLILGHDLDADERAELSRAESAPPLAPPEAPYDDVGYAYANSYGGPPRSGFPRPDRVTPLARPNGFPVVPGAIGSQPLTVGPNGYPILDGSAGSRRSTPAPRSRYPFSREAAGSVGRGRRPGIGSRATNGSETAAVLRGQLDRESKNPPSGSPRTLNAQRSALNRFSTSTLK